MSKSKAIPKFLQQQKDESLPDFETRLQRVMDSYTSQPNVVSCFCIPMLSGITDRITVLIQYIEQEPYKWEGGKWDVQDTATPTTKEG